MNLLIYSRYQRQGASSRLRLFQYISYFKAQGVQVEVQTLFSDEYVADLQQGRRNVMSIAAAYCRRVKCVVSIKKYDLIWIEKELFPWLPAWFEHYLLPKNIPYVLDYDDAVFHCYDESDSDLVRLLLRDKHRHLIRRATKILAGNQYLADYAHKANARSVSVVPTVISLARYPEPKYLNTTSASPVVGWIGQRATAYLLQPLVPLMNKLMDLNLAQFVAIGVDAVACNLPMQSVKWSEQTEVASLSAFDIGIMPLFDAPFERGKCGYKLIQYMACGLPVIASPVGVNRILVEHGVNGYLVETEQEWREALLRLLKNPLLRQQMGRAGRRKVEQHYSLEVLAPQVFDLLKKASEVSA